MTWLLVSTRPDLLMIMPVAAAAAPLPLYFRSLLMTTRPGRTACSTFRSVLWLILAPGESPPAGPLPLNGLLPLPKELPGLLADGCWLPLSANATTRPPAAAAIAATATYVIAVVRPRRRGRGGWP